MMRWLTPLLAVTTELPDTIDDPAVATNWILAGHEVYVPDYTVAAEVLRLLGLSEDKVARRIRFSQTCQL
jgi:hypothetical protein